MSGRYAVVSVGTNSTRALLADISEANVRVAFARSIGTRIGEGLGERGELGEEPMQRTLAAVSQLLAGVRGRYVRLLAVATSALRRADNGEAFLERMRETLGVPVRVLSGEEEAIASYRGAIAMLGAVPGTIVGVVDLGGGSTEYAYGSGRVPDDAKSYEIGAVRLTEAFPALRGEAGPVPAGELERAKAFARETLAPLDGVPRPERVVLVGGTATTAATVARGSSGPVAGFRLTRAELQARLEQLCSIDLEARRALPGMRVQRADILPAGIAILDAALERLNVSDAVASGSDLLLGIALEAYEARRPAGTPPGARGPAGTPPGARARRDVRRGFRG